MKNEPGSLLTAVYNDGHTESNRTTSIAIKRRKLLTFLQIQTNVQKVNPQIQLYFACYNK